MLALELKIARRCAVRWREVVEVVRLLRNMPADEIGFS
jgi:hypothetical protein